VGRFISTNQVLLRHQPQVGTWQRVPPQEMLAAGDRLLSLPTFRSTIALSSGVTVELLGGTEAVLQPAGIDGVLGLRVNYGRAVMRTSGKPETRLRVLAGQRDALATFVNPASSAAVEVRLLQADGVDPAKQPSGVRADLYVSEDKIVWVDDTGMPPQTIEAPATRSIDPPGAVASGEAFLPDWILAEPIRPGDKIGAEYLAEYLSPDRPTVQRLLEAADNRRIEVRALALRSLSYLGEYEPLVKALNQTDVNQRVYWSDVVDDLKAGVARSPEDAAKIREAFLKLRGESGTPLYRMFWGYTAADLKGGADATLVEYLDHDDMDFRALAFWNLRDITGEGLFYRPDTTAAARRSRVQTWKQRQMSGQIVPKAKPAPMEGSL
jgi:hypothetical protein